MMILDRSTAVAFLFVEIKPFRFLHGTATNFKKQFQNQGQLIHALKQQLQDHGNY
jgi:hypothetical protein